MLTYRKYMKKFIDPDHFEALKKRYLNRLISNYKRYQRAARDKEIITPENAELVIKFNKVIYPLANTAAMNNAVFDYALGEDINIIMSKTIERHRAMLKELEYLSDIRTVTYNYHVLWIFKTPFPKKEVIYDKYQKIYQSRYYKYHLTVPNLLKLKEFNSKEEKMAFIENSIIVLEEKYNPDFHRNYTLYKNSEKLLNPRKVIHLLIISLSGSLFRNYLKGKGINTDESSNRQSNQFFLTKYKDESTTARQVLVMHYIFKELRLVENTDATHRARLVQFLTNKNWDSIYNKVRNPLKLNDSESNKDLSAIIPLFQKIGLHSVVEQIKKEIESSE